jgi:Transposase IS66 family
MMVFLSAGWLHAWYGAHGLRDLAGLYRFDPGGQLWARAMAGLLIDANAAATAARAAGRARLSDEQQARIRARYLGAVAKRIAGKTTQIGKDGLRLARRFRDHQDMILRFSTDLAVGFTSNQAEREVCPVKVQQRTSGGCRRTLADLAGFAIVQSYLSTAAKWGIDALDALTQLFTDGPWLPPATAPPDPARPRSQPHLPAATRPGSPHADTGAARPRTSGHLPADANGQATWHVRTSLRLNSCDVAGFLLTLPERVGHSER